MIKYVLAHRIRISEILPWDIKSYLTHAILPRAHYAAFYLGLHCLRKSIHFEVSGIQRLKLHHLWEFFSKNKEYNYYRGLKIFV